MCSNYGQILKPNTINMLDNLLVIPLNFPTNCKFDLLNFPNQVFILGYEWIYNR
jgi:hypothetical protein